MFSRGHNILVKFNAKGFKISDKTLESMESRIHRRFDKYFNGKRYRVYFLCKTYGSEKLKVKVELTLPYCGGYQLRAEVAEKEGIMAALDRGMDIMERQITRYKTKLSRNKHQTPELVISNMDFEEEPSEYAVVNMNMLGHDFYMFRNSEINKTCVVYRRGTI